MNVNNGSFSLRQSTVEIPLQSEGGMRGLITWSGGGREETKPIGVIQECRLLAGSGVVADLQVTSSR